MNESPRILVVLEPAETGASALRSVGRFTGAGLMATKDHIIAGLPVIEKEMFTNAWFDERGAQLLMDQK